MSSAFADLSMNLLLWSVALLTVLAAYLVANFGSILRRLWKEPVFRFPVLVFESDDWGTGPLQQAEVLRDIRHRIARFRDREGRPAHMTLAIVLGEPSGSPCDGDPLSSPRSDLASDPTYADLLHELAEGERQGVFSLQLHGGEHFNPQALRAGRATSPEVKAWLESTPHARTEDLPPQFQTRWADCSQLPSRALPPRQIERMARAEIQEFEKTFARGPSVAVPPTFIWTKDVESAWGACAVSTIVTPGRAFTGRDADSRPSGSGDPIFNGDKGCAGVLYVVRDIYFEPALVGHTAESVMPRIAERFAQRRPALLETHRANFVGSEQDRRITLDEMERLVELVSSVNADVRYLPTAQIAQAIRDRDPGLIDARILVRVAVFCIRASQLPRLGRLIRLLGLKKVASVVEEHNRSRTRRTEQPSSISHG